MRWILFLGLLFIVSCTNCHMEQYNITESYINGTLVYEPAGMYKYTQPRDVMKAGAVIKIRNADDQAGNFTAELIFTLSNGTKRSVNVTKMIESGETGSFEGEVESDTLEEELIDVSARVIPPSKVMYNITVYEEEVCG